jgi:asparagine synthase (glutamine-hydrolysing)
MLDGMFSFVLLDTRVQPPRMIAARDPIGITTLYQGWNSSDPSTIYFASELKALHDECDQLITFPPGHFYDSATGKTERYYKPTWWEGDSGSEADIPHGPADLQKIKESLEKAVKKRLMSEVPYGVLLSGGLDSSLIAAIAARETEKVVEAQERGRSKARASSLSKKTAHNGDAANGASDGLTGVVEDDIAEGE